MVNETTGPNFLPGIIVNNTRQISNKKSNHSDIPFMPHVIIFLSLRKSFNDLCSICEHVVKTICEIYPNNHDSILFLSYIHACTYKHINTYICTCTLYMCVPCTWLFVKESGFSNVHILYVKIWQLPKVFSLLLEREIMKKHLIT